MVTSREQALFSSVIRPETDLTKALFPEGEVGLVIELHSQFNFQPYSLLINC